VLDLKGLGVNVASRVAGGTVSGRTRRSAEHAFYLAITGAMAAAVLLGFSRSFFLRFLFPEFAAAHAPTERYFYAVHGPLCTGWFLVLMVQPYLVATDRVAIHRRLGWCGAALAVIVVATGIVGGLIAARRPMGFVDVPVPPLQFLLHVVTLFALFGIFVSMAVVSRREPQYHKRWMLLASLNLVAAGATRWPFEFVAIDLPVPYYSMTDVILFFFLAAMVAWDVHSRREVHRATLTGGLAFIAVPPIVGVLSGTHAWLAIAGIAVGLLGK